MTRGRKKAEVVGEPSRARESSELADKNRKDISPTNTTRRRSSRIRDAAESATKQLQHSERKDQLPLERSQTNRARTAKPAVDSHHIAKTTSEPKNTANPDKSSSKKEKSAIQSQRSHANVRTSDPVKKSDSRSGKKSRGRPRSSTNPVERTRQDLESGPQSRSANSSKTKTKTSKRGTRQDQPRGKRSKARLTVAAESPLPVDSSLAAISGEYQTRHPVEQSQLPYPSTALSREALEEHTRSLAPISLTDQIRTIKRISGLLLAGNSVYAQSSDTIDVDPQEVFNYKWGYLPPLGEEAECVLIALLEDPTIAKIMGRTSPDARGFRTGLEVDRNVKIAPSPDPDPRADEINARDLGAFLKETIDQQQCYDELWGVDKAKCTGNSSEALFQRTLMISLIARHTMVYQQSIGNSRVLDFSVEEVWQCPPMPTKAVWGVPKEQAFDTKFLTQPKPDLSLCFHRDSVIPEDVWGRLPPPTRALACFENIDGGASRVFHFLTIEAKKAMISIDANKALYQSLNNASQALHNIFEFFRDAGSKHEEIFFDNVRFFSVAANSNGLLVRIHRAIEVPENGLLVMPDQPNYRLKFVYREFARINGSDEYSRGRVLDVFKKILRYAMNDLGKWIEDAASDLAKKLQKDRSAFHARRDEQFYRYEQPSPLPTGTKQTPGGSVVQSSRGRSTAVNQMNQQLQNSNLISSHLASVADQSMNSRQITPRPQELEMSSQQSKVTGKRGRNDLDAASTNGEESQDIRKRPKASAPRRKANTKQTREELQF